jgi:E3 ubiquitin-protein ligase HUWE1
LLLLLLAAVYLPIWLLRVQLRVASEMAKIRERRDKWRVEVRRALNADTNESLPPVEETLQKLGNCPDLRRPLQVKFEGEQGIDAGGLTVELFHGLFTALMDSRSLFAKHDAEDPDLPLLPVPSPDESQRKQLLVVGRLLAKMLHDGHHASALGALPTYFFKYLWARVFGGRDAGDVLVTNRDYEEFVGWKVARERQACLLLSPDDLDMLCLIFTDCTQEPPQEVSVTPRNVRHYLQSVRNDIAISRQEGLEAVVAGFQDPALVGAGTLDVLQSCRCTWNELRHLLAGCPNLDRARLVRLLKFDGFEEGDDQARQRKEWVKEAVRTDLTDGQLASFLLFVTGNDTVPVVPSANYLTIQHWNSAGPAHLPQAHTCFNTLDLPAYASKAVFLEKLGEAVRSGQAYLNA